jgi:uncharacterized membrane protein YkoI
MKRNAKVAAVAATVGAVFVLGACGGGGGSAESSPASSAASGAPSPAEMGPGVPLEKAGATAEKRVDRGTLTSIELENGAASWEAQVVAPDGTEHEINVATSSGKVTSAHVKKESAADRAKHRTRVAAAKLDYAAAARKMRGAVPGGKITELNLDDHRGTTVWEGDVRAGNVKHEVTLDAASGAVIAKN